MGERSVHGNGSNRSLKRLARRPVAALSVAGLALLLGTAGALAATGALTQPAGTAGCISETGAGPCADGHGLDAASRMAMSADGKSVYVASGDSDAVVRLNRNTTTGAITQPAGAAGCISETGAGPCANGHGLDGAYAIALSPNGKSVYVASVFAGAVVRLNRNTTTGAISQPAGAAGCISDDGSGPCADGRALSGPYGVAVSPNGKNVYVGSGGSSAVVRLNRNTTTGAISQPAGAASCISDDGSGPCADGHAIQPYGVVVSPDGKSVYVPSFFGFSNAVVRLNRNTTTGAITQPAGTAGCISETGSGPCADGRGLFSPTDVAVSPNGKNVYVASFDSDAVVRLNRNTTTGAITQPAGTAGCISETGSQPCANGHALSGAYGVEVSPDGKNVYAGAQTSTAVVRLNRNTTTGALSQFAGAAGCISEDGSGPCADGHGLPGPFEVAVSPNGKNVYAATHFGDTVARLTRAP